MDIHEATLIPKEAISNLNFDKTEHLDNEHDRITRSHNLEKALILGNSYKKKVRIIFHCTLGIRAVETTVWAVTEKNVLLKSGVYIPISNILEVDLYHPS